MEKRKRRRVCQVCGGRTRRGRTCSADCAWALRRLGPEKPEPLKIYEPPRLKGPDRCKERACAFPAAQAGGWCRQHAALFAVLPEKPAMRQGQGTGDKGQEVAEAVGKDTRRGRQRRPIWAAQAAAVAQSLADGNVPVWLL